MTSPHSHLCARHAGLSPDRMPIREPGDSAACEFGRVISAGIEAAHQRPGRTTLDSFNSLVEAYIHDSKQQSRHRRKHPSRGHKTSTDPSPHLRALKGEEIGGTSLPNWGRGGGGRVGFAGKAARLARLRADIRPSGGGFSCVRAGSAMRRSQRHCRPGRHLRDRGPEYSTTRVAEARANLARPGPRLRFDRLCFHCWPPPRKRCQG
jgi:hypothetical protein